MSLRAVKAAASASLLLLQTPNWHGLRIEGKPSIMAMIDSWRGTHSRIVRCEIEGDTHVKV
jgi:hypothetical protein